MSLRFAEELLLLTLNEDYGDLTFMPDSHLRLELAGAVLMDLALENRIDTDLEKLFLVDATPVGDDLLDPVLARVEKSAETHNAEYWVRHVAEDGDWIRATALARLVKADILQSAEEGAIVPSPEVARAHRYPPDADGTHEQEVRLRVMSALFSDDIPTPRDIVIICLANACGLFERILSKAELEKARDRIDLISRMDLIGQVVTRAVRDSIESSVAPAIQVKKIPLVKGALLFGSARQAAEDIRGLLTEQYLKLGPVFEVRLLHRRMLVLAGPEANQFANKKGHIYFRSYSPWRGFADGLGADRLILNMDGKDHVALRKAFSPSLSRAKFQQHLGLAKEAVHRGISHWPQGEAIGPLHAMQQIIADQMGEILAGQPASDYLDDMVLFLEILLSTAITRQVPMFLFARKFRKARARVEELARKVLESHLPGGPFHNSGDMISDLIDLHENDPQLMPETDLNAMVLSPFMVGIETVANACAFTLYAILKHPELMAGIVAEADEYFAGAPTVEGLRRMDLTYRTVLEAMRMYPTTPAVFRSVANSFDFGGCHIPAGKHLFLGTTVTHRLPEFFPDPDRFDIDRYLPDRAEHRQPYAYVPFGVGMHRCLGNNFAEVQMLLTIAAIFHAAEIEMEPPDWKLKMTNVPTPRPHKSFRIKVKRLRLQGSP